MKEYPIKIMNLKDLIHFQAYVVSNHLHGEIRQKDFVTNIRFGLYIAMALPLDEATLCLKDCPEEKAAEIMHARSSHV